mgnify:CR=1 FL=1
MTVMIAKLNEIAWLNDNLYNDENTISIVKSIKEGYVLVDETKDLLLKENAVELKMEVLKFANAFPFCKHILHLFCMRNTFVALFLIFSS